MPQVLFGVQSYESRSLQVSAQRCVNMFLERTPPQTGKSQVPLFGVPGLTSFSTCGDGPIRGLWNMNDVLYAVSNTSLYQVAQNGTATLLGSGITGDRPVSMADNGTELVVVNGSGGWIWDAINGFRPITDSAFYPADVVTFFDNYFVFNRTDTNVFFLSGILDGVNYNALDFASAEASTRKLVSLAQNLQLLFLFSVDHIEVWYDAGTPDFPFQRYAGGVIWRGCVAPLSVIKQDTAIFFLGDDLVFYRLQGNMPLRVSNHGIEKLFREEEQPEHISCFAISSEGHKWVVVTLAERTVIYDATTNTWHERESWDANDESLFRWRGNCSAEAYGKVLIGDSEDGVISYIDWDNYTERGNTIQAKIHSAPIHFDQKRVYVNRLELDFESGTGLTTGAGSEPQIMLGYSKDSGETWETLQPWRSLGKIGERTVRQKWVRLGQAYEWVFEVTITDPVKRVFVGAHADLTVGL